MEGTKVGWSKSRNVQEFYRGKRTVCLKVPLGRYPSGSSKDVPSFESRVGSETVSGKYYVYTQEWGCL